jgi:hypothetical protein
LECALAGCAGMAEAAAAKARRPTRTLGCILQELEAEKAGQDMLLFKKHPVERLRKAFYSSPRVPEHHPCPAPQSCPTCSGDTH